MVWGTDDVLVQSDQQDLSIAAKVKATAVGRMQLSAETVAFEQTAGLRSQGGSKHLPRISTTKPRRPVCRGCVRPALLPSRTITQQPADKPLALD